MFNGPREKLGCDITLVSPHKSDLSVPKIDVRYEEVWLYSGWMRLGPLLSVYFQWVSICGSCPLAEFTGWTRVVVLSFNAVIKRAVFVSLSKFSLKWVTAATFTRSFRVLSWKKIYLRRYLLHFQSFLSQLFKFWKCQLMCCFKIVVSLRSKK